MRLLPMLRAITMAEAVSYLVLLGIAMPIKYWGDNPMPVKVCGMIHGFLFLLLLWLMMRAHFEAKWEKSRLWLLFAASLVPLWPFFLDRRLREWIAATPTSGGVQ